ncbi:hypothetical protein SLS60_001612 [Paraconiothyrium brasiliense]|uniref:Uncharacterized protein n=1 Tax=Paraconiothyrium brasiliense TaxID=300254 RepID=A0ABR3RZU0_9PLEO
MGGGPKASAANLEPLGKRRNFGNPASLSEPKPCASLARDVGERGVASAASSITNGRNALLSSTVGTATDPIVSKDNAASEPVNPALCNLPYEDRPPQTVKATGDDDNDERSERQPDAGSANQVKKLDEAASHKRRRESGPGPQASAANLEPLGKRRRGCTLKASADGISTLTVPRQKFSLNRAVDKPITVVHGPQVDTVSKATDASELKQNGRLLNVMGPAVGSLTRPPMIRATAAAFEHLTPESEVGRREAEEEYDRPLGQIYLSVGNDKYGNDTRCEGTARTHTPSPQRLREKYDNAGRRYDRDHKGHSVRDEVLGRNRAPETICTLTAVLNQEWEMAIVPIETFLFARGHPKGRILINEIVPLHLVGPTITYRTAVTIINAVVSAPIAKRKSQATVKSQLGVNTKALSIKALTQSTRTIKDLDQLDMAILSMIAANDPDHLDGTAVLGTGPVIVVII